MVDLASCFGVTSTEKCIFIVDEHYEDKVEEGLKNCCMSASNIFLSGRN